MIERKYDEVVRPHPSARWPKRDEPDNRLEPECWPAIRPTFSFNKEDPIYAIGSCFAQNIEAYLHGLGFNLPVRRLYEASGSPQSLNKYTPPSIFQELEWTKAIFDRDDTVRDADIGRFLFELPNGKFTDLQKHTIDRGGVTFEEALAIRRERYSFFRQAFICRIAIITLGLIECWWDTATGQAVEMNAVFRTAQDRFVFRRLSYPEAHDYTTRALNLLREGGTQNVLITTSPVPLSRTFTDDDVIIANAYSKSVLRSVCGQLAEERGDVDYFPSYESVTLTRRSEVWLNDLVHVSPAFVGRIMGRVIETYTGEALTAEADDHLLFNNLVAARNWTQATEIYDRIAGAIPSTEPAAAMYHLDSAELMVVRGDLSAADSHLREMPPPRQVVLDGNDLFRLARAFEAVGRLPRARAARERALAGTATPNRLLVRTHYLVLAGRTEDARLVIESVKEKAKGDIEWLLALGDCWLKVGEPSMARRAYEDAAVVDPQDRRPRQKTVQMDRALSTAVSATASALRPRM
jgi:tetratricopeptide (TPR) repeat protein